MLCLYADTRVGAGRSARPTFDQRRTWGYFCGEVMSREANWLKVEEAGA
jgi:hypothetical protein